MITLLTGLPGNGKTLFALWYVKKKAERENRPVYYHNIRDLTLPWTAHDPEKWQDLPAGSIMVIDEAQQVFPKLGNGAKRPDHYEKLATHRHLGIDLFIITQTPALVDLFVRELVGQHFNSVRKFGLERSSIYEWSKVTMSPGSPAAMKSAIPLKWAYPKEVYGYYTSAEVHTVKKSIPLKLILAAAFVVAVPVTGYFVLDWWQKKNSAPPEPIPVAQQGAIVQPVQSGYGSGSKKEEFDPVVDARIFVQQNTPRVAGLPQTAPKYDDLTVPTRVPVPAACIQIGVAREGKPAPRCKCFTQAGTPMEVEYNMCINIAQNGYFLDFDPDARREQQQAQAQRAERSVEVLADRPESGSYSRQAPTVVAFSSPAVGGSSPVVQASSEDVPRARRAIVGSVQ